MRAPTLRFTVSDVVRGMTMTVRVRGLRAYRIRVRIGVLLIKLAGWIMGFGKTAIVDAGVGES